MDCQKKRVINGTESNLSEKEGYKWNRKQTVTGDGAVHACNASFKMSRVKIERFAYACSVWKK